MKVLLCSCNNLILFIFGWVAVTCFLWASMYGMTSIVLFNMYRWACDNYWRPMVTTLNPRVPLPLILESWRLWGTPTSLAVLIYSKQNSIASSTIYLSTMLAFGQYWFFLYPFNTFMYRSIGYIQCKKIGPQNRISRTRWIIKWIMMSKNDGGKYISNSQRIVEASFMMMNQTILMMPKAQVIDSRLIQDFKIKIQDSREEIKKQQVKTSYRISIKIIFQKPNSTVCFTKEFSQNFLSYQSDYSLIIDYQLSVIDY